MACRRQGESEGNGEGDKLLSGESKGEGDGIIMLLISPFGIVRKRE